MSVKRGGKLSSSSLLMQWFLLMGQRQTVFSGETVSTSIMIGSTNDATFFLSKIFVKHVFDQALRYGHIFMSSKLLQGGAILTQADSKNLNVHISWNVLAGNTASNGGAIFVEGGRMAVLCGNQLYNNKASTNGGAIFIVRRLPLHIPNIVSCISSLSGDCM